MEMGFIVFRIGEIRGISLCNLIEHLLRVIAGYLVWIEHSYSFKPEISLALMLEFGRSLPNSG